jgi:hypothetical protein
VLGFAFSPVAALALFAAAGLWRYGHRSTLRALEAVHEQARPEWREAGRRSTLRTRSTRHLRGEERGCLL